MMDRLSGQNVPPSRAGTIPLNRGDPTLGRPTCHPADGSFAFAQNSGGQENSHPHLTLPYRHPKDVDQVENNLSSTFTVGVAFGEEVSWSDSNSATPDNTPAAAGCSPQHPKQHRMQTPQTNQVKSSTTQAQPDMPQVQPGATQEQYTVTKKRQKWLTEGMSLDVDHSLNDRVYQRMDHVGVAERENAGTNTVGPSTVAECFERNEQAFATELNRVYSGYPDGSIYPRQFDFQYRENISSEAAADSYPSLPKHIGLYSGGYNEGLAGPVMSSVSGEALLTVEHLQNNTLPKMPDGLNPDDGTGSMYSSAATGERGRKHEVAGSAGIKKNTKGKKKFPCPLCGYPFTRNGSLNKHLNRSRTCCQSTKDGAIIERPASTSRRNSGLLASDERLHYHVGTTRNGE